MKAVVFGVIFMAWSAAVLWPAVRRPQIGRVLLSAPFCSMGVVNLITALRNPLAYTDLSGDRAWIPLYRDLLRGSVADHATPLVITVAIAAGAAVLLKGAQSPPGVGRVHADRRTTAKTSGSSR